MTFTARGASNLTFTAVRPIWGFWHGLALGILVPTGFVLMSIFFGPTFDTDTMYIMVAAAGIVIGILALAFAAISLVRHPTLYREATKGSLVGLCMGVIAAGLIAYARYIRPVEIADIISQDRYFHTAQPIKGEVTTTAPFNNEQVYEIKDGSAPIYVTTSSGLPVRGESIWVIGYVGKSANGQKVMLEHYRRSLE
jgi:hypothetical protein